MEQHLNLTAIKQIPISQYLSRLGIEPVKKSGRSLLYHAPYREDKNPSFIVDTQKNTWYDFATGEGSSIIDLVIRMYNIDFKEAIRQLGNDTIMPAPQVHSATTPEEKEPGIAILKEMPLNNPALLTYLKERCIDIDIAKKYCKELYYMANGKRYFGIGFKNDKGGYEIRNKYFKGATSKDITTIKSNNEGTRRCSVYEGFLDYLAHLTIDKHNMVNDNWVKINTPEENIIILNSVANINKVKDFITRENQLMVTTYLDNDEAGRKAVKELREFMLPERPVLDASVTYKHHKDINEYLTSINEQKKIHVTSKIKL